MKYVDSKEPVVTGLQRISKPGLRVYASKTEIPRVLGGMGIVIVSTAAGHHDRRRGPQAEVGGEMLATSGREPMSRIGRLPIAVPGGVTSPSTARMTVTGPKGDTHARRCPPA